MEKLSKKIISMPVFSVTEGQQLGYIKTLIFDPNTKEIIAFTLDQKGWFKENKIIPFNKVKSLGDDAITIDKSGSVEKPTNLPQIIKLLNNPISLINAKVVTAKGKTLGHIEEFWFHSESGAITRIEVSGGRFGNLLKGKASLAAAEIITIGKDVVMVQDGAEERLISSENNLHNTVKDFKSATSKIWANTLDTTKKWGDNLSKSVGKLIDEEKELSKAQKEDLESDETNNPPPPPEETSVTEKITELEETSIEKNTPENPEESIDAEEIESPSQESENKKNEVPPANS